MIDDEFEWNDDKATSNLDKHGVSFEDACALFHDPFAIELYDDRMNYEEERYILIGVSQSNVLAVVYTERDSRNRIISARKAEPNERRFYHKQSV